MKSQTGIPGRVVLCSSLLILLVFSCDLNAQYKDDKHKYDYHSYVHEKDDPYNPALSGLASFILPGSGQIIAGETWRGLGFMAGYSSCWTGMILGASNAYFINWGTIMAMLGASGIITLHIVAPINAAKVSKVNNLAWRAGQNEGITLKLNPELRLLPNQKIAPVLSLSINF